MPMLTFVPTHPTPPMPFQVPSWWRALVQTSVCSELTDGWSRSCTGRARAATALGMDATCGTAQISLGHPAEGSRTLHKGLQRKAGSTKEEFARDVAVAQSR